MKIQFTPKDFLRLFKLAASAAAARDIKPILQNVKIVAEKEGGAILMATDTDIGIRVRLDVDVLEDGVAVLPIKTLRTILDSTKERTLTMETVPTESDVAETVDVEPDNVDEDDDEYVPPAPRRPRSYSVVLYGQHERHEFYTHNPDEFPNIEPFTAESYHELESDDMKTLIERTMFAIDKDTERFALGGVCFEGKVGEDVLTAIATDGRRLAVQTTDRCMVGGDPTIGNTRKETLKDGTEQERIDYPVVCIPVLNLLTKVLNDKSFKKQKKHIYFSTVKMAFTEHHVFFHCEPTLGNEQITIFSRLLEGRFPAWRRIVPDKEDRIAFAEVNSDALFAAVKNVQGMTTDLDPGIYVAFENGQMTLEGRGKEKGTTKTSIEAYCKGKATFKVNHSYLTSMLKTLDDTYVTIRCNGADPLLIETDSENYTYVVMPMSGDDKAPSPNQSWDENGVVLQAADAPRAGEQEEGTESAIEIIDEVPLDNDGDVTTDYYHNEMPNTFVNPVNGTIGHFDEYGVSYPHFCPDEHQFQSEIEHDGITWYMEWDCIPGKRIVPHWERPDRITSPTISIDEHGYMTWEYLESFDEGVPLSVINPATGIRSEYEMELPRFLPEESLFRTTGKSGDGQSVVLEWACLPGKRRLVVTKTVGIGTIDDWSIPSRIIPLDDFTDEIIERSELLAGTGTETADENDVCQWCEESRCACDYEDEPSEWATDEADESEIDEPENESAIGAEAAERERIRIQTRQIVPINSDGYVDEAYFTHHVSVITVDDPENETYTEYEPDVPRYHHGKSLYRAKARTAEFDDDGERLRVILEWDSFDSTMSLAHWQNPDRIIPLTGKAPEPESGSPDGTPNPPLAQNLVAEPPLRPANRPRSLPRPKQTALTWT